VILHAVFDPAGSLQVARDLDASATSEAEWRTVVGRAYYAVFITARDRLFPSPVPPRSIRRRGSRGRSALIPIHQAVLNEVARRSTAVGSQLQQLHDLRIEADYHRTPTRPARADWRKNSESAVIVASNILGRVRAI
jgi:hypothetical protein